MAISCVYCGATHDEAAQVRACWQRSEAGGTAQQLPVEAPADAVARPAPAMPVADAGPGPVELGRNLIIRPGQDVPPEWRDASRVTIEASDASSGRDLVDELQPLARARHRVVFELSPDAEAALDRPESTDAPPSEVGARFRFDRDDLRHLVRANSVDLTSGSPRWPLLDRAVTLGAQVVAEGAGDVVLPDGRR
ncbi:MAG: hypothetical protein HZB15_09905, partial [Actinobacteria bacterium]|nr:hypothetical protein [Actinomycetota bacterium]